MCKTGNLVFLQISSLGPQRKTFLLVSNDSGVPAEATAQHPPARPCPRPPAWAAATRAPAPDLMPPAQPASSQTPAAPCRLQHTDWHD